MKRVFFSYLAMLLLMAMVLPMCGCGRQTEFHERPLPTTQPTEPAPELSAYQAMVSGGYTGTAEEFFTLLAYEIQGIGSAFEAVCEQGYTGTMRQWYEDLLAKQR